MNTVRVGAARFVITTIFPLRSRMKRRLVSLGGDVIHTGPLRDNPGKALFRAYPNWGGAEGKAKVVLGTRWFNPEVWADRLPAPNNQTRTALVNRKSFMA
jgi:hypothetical protein